MTRPRRSLFMKYFVTLFVAVATPLVLGSATEAWFAFRDNVSISMNGFRSMPARQPIGSGLSPTEYAISSAGWCSFPGPRARTTGTGSTGLRLLQQVPAIVSLSLVDPTGTERVSYPA